MRTDQIMALLCAEIERKNNTEEEERHLEEGLTLALSMMNQLQLAQIVAEATWSNETSFLEFLQDAYKDAGTK